MIISHTHKFIHIKSIKTAGTSIEAVLSNHCSGNDVVTPLNDFRHNRDEKGRFIHHSMNAEEYHEIGQHVDALTTKSRLPASIWDEYFKFSIIRNPWDRVVSYFFWQKRNDPALQPRKRFYHYFGVPFDNLATVRKAFAEYVKAGEWMTNDCFYLIDDELCVDFTIRYENLMEDYAEVCKRVGVRADPLPRLKGGMRRRDHHYSEYFDEESAAIVRERHRNDIRLFGYEFERR